MAEDRRRWQRAAKQALESLQAAGVTQLDRRELPPIDDPREDDRFPVRDSSSKNAGDDPLQLLRSEVACCTRCPELARTRTQTVFGVGNPEARLCFLGEAPGAEEDRQGEPFVGAAGQLLSRILNACHMCREDVYILNILQCRPPGNRNPAEQEAANCRQFVDRQLELVDPEWICCLGAVAAQNLLETKQPIGRLRGRFHTYRDMQVMCTYHPAYLLRNPAAKKQVWEDMQMLMNAMDIPV